MGICCEDIKKLRKQRHITQEQLAEASGYTKSAISAWERGKYVPSEYQLLRLHDAICAILVGTK